MDSSRTINVSRNTIVALACQLINLLLNFITRTIFVKTLGTDYLGVNGLFTNILTVLSFAELGIGNAIIYNLYKPLAKKDTNKILSLMSFYRRSYDIIGIIILIVGLCITPFLKYIIKDEPSISENIYLLYILFLLSTVVSYFFVYKKNMIIADQKNYIVLLIAQSVTIIRTIFQTVFLVLTHNFIIYLVIQIFFVFVENVVCSIIADSLYPYLRQKALPLSKHETKNIFNDVKALVMYKFGSVLLNGTDNILVSMLSGVNAVGLVSNYVLLTSSCSNILSRIVEAFTASVGNLNATEGSEKQYIVFKKMFLITAWIYGYASVCLILLSNKFVKLWLGEEYLLQLLIIIAIVSEFYVKGVHATAYTFRTTLGYFVQGKWSAILAALLNIVLSVLLYNVIGLAGIFVATPIARLFTTGLVDPILIYKKSFKKNPSEYFIMYTSFFAIFTVITFFCAFIISFIKISKWYGIVVEFTVITIVFNIIMLLCFFNTKIFKELIQSIKHVIRKG